MDHTFDTTELPEIGGDKKRSRQDGQQEESASTSASPSPSSSSSFLFKKPVVGGTADHPHHKQSRPNNSFFSKWGGVAGHSKTALLKFESDLTLPDKRKATEKGNILAVQSRILEAFCRSRPEIDMDCFPRGQEFTRKHFLFGVLPYVIEIMNLYNKADFFSPSFLCYCLTGLVNTIDAYSAVMEDGEKRSNEISNLIDRLVSNKDLQNEYFDRMPRVGPDSPSSPGIQGRGNHEDDSDSD